MGIFDWLRRRGKKKKVYKAKVEVMEGGVKRIISKRIVEESPEDYEDLEDYDPATFDQFDQMVT